MEGGEQQAYGVLLRCQHEGHQGQQTGWLEQESSLGIIYPCSDSVGFS